MAYLIADTNDVVGVIEKSKTAVYEYLRNHYSREQLIAEVLYNRLVIYEIFPQDVNRGESSMFDFCLTKVPNVTNKIIQEMECDISYV